jgi:aromatic-L-amino-acid/L-tryptophan decarboxylase
MPSFEMGGILVAQGHLLRESFQIRADYLEGIEQQHVNLQDYSPQQTRNFRALKLWLSIKAFG